jgi:hypothetical protein
LAITTGLDVVLLVKEKKNVNAYYSNADTKVRIGQRVNEFFECQIEKKSVEVQVGSGRITKKHLENEKKKRNNLPIPIRTKIKNF